MLGLCLGRPGQICRLCESEHSFYFVQRLCIISDLFSNQSFSMMILDPANAKGVAKKKKSPM